MNDKKHPFSKPGATEGVMPDEVADLAESSENSRNGTDHQQAGDDAHQKLEKEVKEATDLPQKGSA